MLHTCGDPRRRPAYAKARQGAADINQLSGHEKITVVGMLNPTIPSGQTLKKLDTTYHHLGPHSYMLAYELHWLWL